MSASYYILIEYLIYNNWTSVLSFFFFFSSRRRHTRCSRDWSSDVCSSDLRSRRRLIEAGVGCVTLGYGGWDTHSDNFNSLRRQLPNLDRGIANLIQDLHEIGRASCRERV